VSDKHRVRLRVNGTGHELLVEARRTLADMLRHDLGYTGTNVGCEHGICGACTVRLDGAPVRSCLIFGVQADGAEVRTVEGLADGDELSDLQQAFRDHHALQCGFCTPGFLMLAEAYFAERGLGLPALAERGLGLAGTLTAAPPENADPGRGPGPAGTLTAAPPENADPGRGPGLAAAPPRPCPRAGEEPTEAEIRELVASNLCRCTGYQGIVAAMLATAQARHAAARQEPGTGG
jgi:aerobic-type carbon monoxide dehydrogenase small subunit (CoxS/CutS family)